ncbi:ATPase [Amnibacterium sp. CER49]|uniref:MinD/ParA family ATP-binding protein n=1 Tax=Amnibacterium sp. CER49 TaxID=3039161 RepID=UPI0024477491|nr:ATPase [Amnibacterium sp. CER49]MDH2443535.1 ATPase [Amnibacterium sp. CER49]
MTDPDTGTAAAPPTEHDRAVLGDDAAPAGSIGLPARGPALPPVKHKRLPDELPPGPAAQSAGQGTRPEPYETQPAAAVHDLRPATRPAAADAVPAVQRAPQTPEAQTAVASQQAAPRPEPAAPLRTRRGDRKSFLDRGPDVAPPTRGWRAAANRLGFSVGPSADEVAEREDIRVVSRSWDGPRTIAVVNGKGGANKTPTTAMLAAVFARYGSAGVLAWDNNETRGTLGWRTEQGLHDATVHDLLPRAAELMMPAAEVSDLARYVHHQPLDRYDVLRSNPRVLANQQHLTRGDFDTLHKVMRKYYRLLILDSGNDESADRWQQMIQRADAIVIATTALGEHAEAGALLLEQLAERDARTAALAAGATVIVSQSDPNLAHGDARAIAAQFRSIARAAVTVPFDDAMHSGRLRYDELARPTQRAWLAAAAAVAEGL